MSKMILILFSILCLSQSSHATYEQDGQNMMETIAEMATPSVWIEIYAHEIDNIKDGLEYWSQCKKEDQDKKLSQNYNFEEMLQVIGEHILKALNGIECYLGKNLSKDEREQLIAQQQECNELANTLQELGKDYPKFLETFNKFLKDKEADFPSLSCYSCRESCPFFVSWYKIDQ